MPRSLKRLSIQKLRVSSTFNVNMEGNEVGEYMVYLYTRYVSIATGHVFTELQMHIVCIFKWTTYFDSALRGSICYGLLSFSATVRLLWSRLICGLR